MTRSSARRSPGTGSVTTLFSAMVRTLLKVLPATSRWNYQARRWAVERDENENDDTTHEDENGGLNERERGCERGGDVILKEFRNRVKHLGQGAGLLADGDHLRSQTGEYAGPRISQYVERMRTNVAGVLGIDTKCVGIGATSGEGLSAHSKGRGINVIAQVSLKRVRGR